MAVENEKKTGWGQRLKHELVEYLINFIFLALFFSAFTWFRRIILAQHGIAYAHYGIALIEALVLAKIVMLGDTLKLGKRLEDKPLIVPTMYKTVVFTIWVAVFKILEDSLIALLRGKGIEAGPVEMLSVGWYELMARCIIVFFAFIPFFAFRELGRAIGMEKLMTLFFRKGSDPNSRPEG